MHKELDINGNRVTVDHFTPVKDELLIQRLPLEYRHTVGSFICETPPFESKIHKVVGESTKLYVCTKEKRIYVLNAYTLEPVSALRDIQAEHLCLSNAYRLWVINDNKARFIDLKTFKVITEITVNKCMSMVSRQDKIYFCNNNERDVKLIAYSIENDNVRHMSTTPLPAGQYSLYISESGSVIALHKKRKNFTIISPATGYTTCVQLKGLEDEPDELFQSHGATMVRAGSKLHIYEDTTKVFTLRLSTDEIDGFTHYYNGARYIALAVDRRVKLYKHKIEIE
jgi:hypothetical protein